MLCPETTTAPLRAGPTFAAMAIGTCARPLPLAGPEIAIHGTSVAADHPQPAAVSTWIADAVAAAGAFRLGGLTETLQPLACVTTTRCPDTTTAPLRAGPTFAAMASGTCADPRPVADPETVIHGTSDAMDHPQLAAVSTPIAEVAPAAGAFRLAGLTDTLHPPP
jgi:hypothetical protein